MSFTQSYHLHNTKTMETYKKISKLGEGSYSIVFKGLKKNFLNQEGNQKEEYVAIKEISLYKDEDMSLYAIKEVSLMRDLKHNNILKLYDVFHHNDKIKLILEYMDFDLRKYMDTRKSLSINRIKSFLFQLLSGLHFCHQQRILHRDLKPQNLLINYSGELKIADFGLAKEVNMSKNPDSNEVVTLWYRSPDLLLGIKNYQTSVDLWSVGCIFAEMVTGCALFRGHNNQDQLLKIFEILGTPTEATWPNVTKLAEYRNSFPMFPPKSYSEIFPNLEDEGLSLLSSFLEYEPSKRISAQDALHFPFLAGSTIFPLEI